jgi:hypothetical protein
MYMKYIASQKCLMDAEADCGQWRKLLIIVNINGVPPQG